MPTYDYKCGDCSSEFEESRRIAQRNDPVQCPNCGEYTSGRVFKVGSGGFVDPGILNADKNLEVSGVGKRLSEMKAAHPYLIWKG